MAAIRIETWQNEDLLWDYAVYRNGHPAGYDGNYTTEDAAISAAKGYLRP